jgi:bifunctional DNA primase/polymerase-like protein
MPNKPALNTTPAPSNAMLDEALSLAAKGFPVFRLAYKTKSPLADSHGFYDATTDPAVITELFSQALYNVAIRTGVAMNVLDVDPLRGGFNSFKAMIDAYGEPFDVDGPKIVTGSNGWHFPFQVPEGEIRSGKDAFGFPGVDIKADRGYVVAPPSIHPNGLAYIYEEGRSYDDLAIPPLSERWLVLLRAPRQVQGDRRNESTLIATPVGCGVIDPNFTLESVDITAIRRELADLVRSGALGDKATFEVLVLRPDLQYLAAIGRGLEPAAVVRAIRTGYSGKIYCVKPGHDPLHTSKSADLRVHPRYKTLQYIDYHGAENERKRAHRIPDLQANMPFVGREIKLSNAELKAWQVRLWVLDGLLPRADVPHVPLPERLPAQLPANLQPIKLTELQQVYDVAIDALSIKWLYSKGPQALTHKYLSVWGGLSERLVAKAMPWLLYFRVLKGGVYLQPHGGLSSERGGERNPECFVPGEGWKKERPPLDLAQICPCGCNEILPLRGGKPVKWAGPGCRQRFWRSLQEKERPCKNLDENGGTL